MNNYELMEDFLLRSIKDSSHQWVISKKNLSPNCLKFKNENIEIYFRKIKENILEVEIENIKTIPLFKKEININKIPKLMTYLAKSGEINFQISIQKEIGNVFFEVNDIVTELLKGTKVKGFSLKKELFIDKKSDNPIIEYTIYKGNNLYVQLNFKGLDEDYLGVVNLHCFYYNSPYSVNYRKLIALNDLPNYPQLEINIPDIISKETKEPETIKLIKKINLDLAGNLKPVILSFLLEKTLKEENINKKKIKI